MSARLFGLEGKTEKIEIEGCNFEQSEKSYRLT